MNDWVSKLFSNPELIRNVRSQLRPGRIYAILVICALFSLSAGTVAKSSVSQFEPPGAWGITLLRIAFYIQITALLLGGGVACVQSISREKDLNTFDFQRVTRLTPLELTVGKLFGAPALSYFVALCFVPAAIVGAIVGRARPSFVLAAYTILFLGCVCAHAFALLVSLLIDRAAASGAVMLFILACGVFAYPAYGLFDIGQLSPYYGSHIVVDRDWSPAFLPPPARFDEGSLSDLFFGTPVPHALVLVVIYLVFTTWYLLALARNIKRDPAAYEIFSPMQFFGVLLWINFLFLAFFSWRTLAPFDAQGVLLGFNGGLFLVLGMVLLRNRDRIRRSIRELGDRALDWTSSAWPAPYIFAGSLVVGFAAVGMIDVHRWGKEPWDLGLALFRLVFFSLWLVRDILYLQWMNLSRAKRPLATAILYLIVYYTCLSIFYGFAHFKDYVGQAAFMPFWVLNLDFNAWTKDSLSWSIAAIFQLVPIAIFIYLQRNRLEQIAGTAPRLAAATSPAA